MAPDFDSEQGEGTNDIMHPASLRLYIVPGHVSPNAAAFSRRAREMFQERRQQLKSALEDAARSMLDQLPVRAVPSQLWAAFIGGNKRLAALCRCMA